MVNKKVGIIIQARMASSRLPNKILLKLPYDGETSIIEHIVKRSKASKNANQVVVATSENPENDILEEVLRGKCKVFRGSEENVLSRFYLIAEKFKFDTIVRLTADNPCFDSIYIDKAIDLHIENNADYTYTKGLPLGMNIEVLSFSSLKDAHKNANKVEELEHVTPYVSSNPQKYKLYSPELSSDYFDWRLTTDTPSDYALMCLLYKDLYSKNNLFGYKEIKKLLQENPWATLINKDNHQVNVYETLADEKQDAIMILNKNGLYKTANFLNR